MPEQILFTNVRILDGSGAMPVSGEVLVEGNRIKEVHKSPANLTARTPNDYGQNYSNGNVTKFSSPLGSARNFGNRTISSPSEMGATVIDGMGATLMPGLCDAHLHLSWNNAPGIDPIQMMPPEEHTLWTAQMAKLVLDSGFTSGFGAAAAKPRLDVVIRNAINSGMIPGPRYRAAGPEITTVGGLGDSAPSHIPHEGLNLGIVVSGPEEVRRVVRTLIKYGVDSIKLNLSGEEITKMPAETTPMSEEEITMAVREAKCRDRVLSAHARSAGSVKQCVRHGIQNIYHASFADNEALDMLEAAKDKHFVAPGLAWLINTARYAGDYGIKPGSALADAYERELAYAVESCRAMHKRGIKLLIGGDYGFAWTPTGTNAKDLAIFVDMLGFTPSEAIVAATKYGGEIMGMAGELGQIKPGYLADLLLVDGDPIANIAVLQDHGRLLAIMKDGKFHKAPKLNEHKQRGAA